MNYEIFEQKHIIDIILSIEKEPGRFNLLQKEFDINTSTLQKRLESLEKSEIIWKKKCPIDGRSCAYIITEYGKKIAGILNTLKKTCKNK